MSGHKEHQPTTQRCRIPRPGATFQSLLDSGRDRPSLWSVCFLLAGPPVRNGTSKTQGNPLWKSGWEVGTLQHTHAFACVGIPSILVPPILQLHVDKCSWILRHIWSWPQPGLNFPSRADATGPRGRLLAGLDLALPSQQDRQIAYWLESTAPPKPGGGPVRDGGRTCEREERGELLF